MLTHPTRDRLVELGLQGMARAFDNLAARPETRSLEHADWLALLLEHEAAVRRQKRFETRARAARLRHAASVEDVDYRSARGLDRNLFLKLASCEWIRDRQGLLLTGPAGVGKSWLACALGHKACRDNHSVLYVRAPKLFDDLALAHADGSAGRRLKALDAVQLLIIYNWGLGALDDQGRHDLLEILEERYGRRSTLVTSQVPVDRWYEIIGEPNVS